MRVDLNPARTKMAETLEDSGHTSIKARLESRSPVLGKSSRSDEDARRPVASLDADALLDMTESNYIELVQWTGEQLHPLKRGKLRSRINSENKPPQVILQVFHHSKRWLRQVSGPESRCFGAIVSAGALMAKAVELGQRWMQGVSGEQARLILRSQTE